MILSSIFRDATGYLQVYADQVASLASKVDGLRLVVAEGDSTDKTRTELPRILGALDIDFKVIHVDHGGPRYGSIDDPNRWRQIAYVDNAVMANVAKTIGNAEDFVYVESDLVWTPETILTLRDGLSPERAMIAPMSMNGRNGRFYDIWGHTKDGTAFEWERPYHPGLNGARYVEIDSAGSCFVTRGYWAQRVRFSETDCIRGIGRSLRHHGGSLWLDTSQEVIHP